MNYLFMSINWTSHDPDVGYHETATAAVEAAGVPKWSSKYPIEAAMKLQPGDEINFPKYGSVVRLTGNTTDYDG